VIGLAEWNDGCYHPVPTIIEAARVLYSGSSVREITHSHAGLQNLTETTDYVLSVVSEAQRNNRKVLCFLTGIPGAGKTLAGLNVVHSREVCAKYCRRVHSNQSQNSPKLLAGGPEAIGLYLFRSPTRRFTH
jgi:hypothetical protein